MSAENGGEAKDHSRGVGNTKLEETVEFKDAAGVPYRLCQIDGQLFPPFGNHQKKQVRDTNVRPDDVILCGYPKTGCHWVWETMSMILKGKGEHSKSGKLEAFLELVSPSVPEAMTSPRILNTHYRYNDLPSQFITIRNPKDTAVSMYNHMFNLKMLYGYDGKFQDWFPAFMDGKVESGDYLSYYLSWQKATEEHPDHPIMVLSYEDLKEDFPSGIRQLSDFLGVTLSEQQVEEIAHAGDIKVMKEHFKNLTTASLFRKGQVGDWKNWMSVAQSEVMNERWGKPLKDSMFNIRYQL